jgi:hypothetical protein
MKAIEIKSELKFPFLEACRLARLEVIQLKDVVTPGILYFRIITPNHSQDDLFKLGVCFGRLILPLTREA